MKRTVSFTLVLMCFLSMVACGKKAPTWQEQYDLGVRYLSEGNYEEAIIAFNLAIEIEPMNPDGYLALARTYEATGDIASAVDALRTGWKTCTDENAAEFIKEIERLGYSIDENGNLQETNWDDIMQTVIKIVYAQGHFLSYEQMRALYEPLIPLLQKYITIYSDRYDGYTYLSEIYCSLNEMDLCLQTRVQGYEKSGDEELNPTGHTVTIARGPDAIFPGNEIHTFDAWGRLIAKEMPEANEVHEYGEGNQVIREVFTDLRSGSFGETNYQYENGRRIRTQYYSDSDLIGSITYEYPEDGKCISHKKIEDMNGMEITQLITFDEYGNVISESVIS